MWLGNERVLEGIEDFFIKDFEGEGWKDVDMVKLIILQRKTLN